MLAHARAVDRPSKLRWALVIMAFASALMSKAMLVTLPLVLLLLDFSPLTRWRPGWRGLVREKIPLFVLSVIVSGVTWWAHHLSPPAVAPGPNSWLQRLENAVGAYGFYIYRTLWPVNLIFPYPESAGRSAGFVAASLVVLVLVSLLVVRAANGSRICWLAGSGMSSH